MYKNIKSLISKDDASHLAKLVKAQPVRYDDETVPGCRGVWYNLSFCNILLGQLCERISKEVGRKLLPTYAYCRIYTKGNELVPHIDRPSCEWSATINLSQSEPWSLYMDGKEIIQDVGDGALYQGCEVYHWRKPFKGSEYIQVFLHYVDANGPYKNNMYDLGDGDVLKSSQNEILRYGFAKKNPFLQEQYIYPKGFLPEECDDIIQSFGGQELESAYIGSGENTKVDEKYRRSNVFWVPPVKRNAWIYERIQKLVEGANTNGFNFDLGELEPIQFTKYDASFQGKYDWHVDGGSGEETNGTRKLSVVVQLSCPNEYKGGELQFGRETDDRIEVMTKNKGASCVFPSYMRHRVTEVTEGTRYSLVAWVAGPPFR